MRPLALKIEGLTSFKTIQEIDFSELDLFVITGPTGSGKSTILDAITFALYGDIARVNDNELRHLISHGSSFARVSLDFEVDGILYRVARRMGRKEAQKATLERIDDGNSVSEVEQSGVKVVNKRLEEIVGLDFNTFVKAVLLPQGAFDRFLKGNTGDRRQILMRLLDLGRYESAGRIARQEAARLVAVLGERAGLIEANYQDATPARLAELKRQLKDARSRHKEIGRAAGEARKVAERTVACEKQKATLEQAASDIDEAVTALAPLEARWPILEQKERETAAALAGAENNVKAAEAALAKARAARDATVKKTGDAATLAVIEQAATALWTEEGTITDLDRELAASVSERQTSAEALTTTTKHANDAEKSLKKQIGELELLESKRERTRAVLVQAEATEVVTTVGRELEKAITLYEKARQQADKNRERRQHLQHEHAAAALRTGLAPGDRCPVCTAVIEVLPETDSDIEALLTRVSADVAAAERLERETNERAVELRTREKVAKQALAQAKTAVDGEAAVTPPEARRLVADAERAVREASVKRKQEEAAAQQWRQELTEAEKQLASSNAKVSGTERLREAAIKRLEGARAALLKEFSQGIPKDLKGQIAKRSETLAAAEKALDDTLKNAEAARRARDERQTAHQASEREIASFDQSLAAARAAARLGCQALGRILREGAFPSLPDAGDDRTKLLNDWSECCAGHLAEAQVASAELDSTISGAVAQLEALAVTIGIELDGDETAAIADAFGQAAVSAERTVAGAEKDVEGHERRIAERGKLEAGIAKDQLRLGLYQSLARELRTDHFIAFVLEESMSLLAVQASDELLRISDGRYSLVADEGSFEVIDHHNADERRSVATLSGGETFLASLSLALALSVGLRELAGAAANRLEAIFIDEGFGALDPETLQVVVDALERLREGDRMVGVISHVEMLAQRIPAGLAVQTDGGSSRIVVR